MSLGSNAEQAARGCGLPKATCMTLLEAGWTLVSDVKGTRWEQGGARLAHPVVLETSAIIVTDHGDPAETARRVASEIMAALP